MSSFNPIDRGYEATLEIKLMLPLPFKCVLTLCSVLGIETRFIKWGNSLNNTLYSRRVVTIDSGFMVKLFISL